MPLRLSGKDKLTWKALEIEDVKVMQMDQFWLKAEGINKSTPSSCMSYSPYNLPLKSRLEVEV